MISLIVKLCTAIMLTAATPVYAQSTGSGYSVFVLLSIVGSGLLLSIIFIFEGFLKKAKKQERINKLTDAETKIGNRAYFVRRFKNDISDFSRTGYFVAYLIVDSNYLQAYNSKLSFADVLQYTASEITANMKNYEFAARVTESGFAMAFHSYSRENAEKRIKSLMQKLTEFAHCDPRKKQGIFNVVLYNLANDDRNCELLLFNLRKNCNSILGEERDFLFCDSHRMNSVMEEKELAESIKKGLKNEEFKLYIQFIVDSFTNDIVSAEALSRWETPEKGILPPGKFIGAMTRSGLITRFDYYMFDMVCRQLEKWSRTSLSGLSISCNFTRITLSEENFLENIKNIAGKYSFDRSRLTIEITEDAMEKNRELAMQNVNECKKLGFGFALDDLGSGYTSLINLCEYPIDFVKIDREILLRADKKRGKDLFNGIVALAQSLNLKVVCEGVETDQQLELVRDTECDYIQGWYFSKAIPASEGEIFVKEFANKIHGCLTN